MLDNFLNVLLVNNMNGSKSYACCECGYEERDVNRNLRICPECGAFRAYGSDVLSFGDIQYAIDSGMAIRNFNNKDLYRFYIILTKVKGTYRINFSKQIIYKNKKNLHESYAIIFDSHAREDKIKYFDINVQEYISEKDMCSKEINYSSYGENYNLDIRGVHFDITENIKSVRGLITKLKSLAKWCSIPHNEILIKAGVDPDHIPEENMNPNGTNPMEILNIKKYTLKQILKYPQCKDTFTTLKSLEDKLGDKAVPYMDKFVTKNEGIWLSGIHADKAITLINEANLSVEKLYKYLYKDAPIQQYLYNPAYTIELLLDSFNMTKQLGMIFDKSPKALVRYHDILAKEINLCENQIKDKKINAIAKKYSYLQKISDKNEDGTYKDKYSIIIPTESKDIVLEGKHMRHCVASYVSKMASEECVILFLRPSQALDISYVTIEYNPRRNTVIQIKGVNNSRVSSEVSNYISIWAKEKKVGISSYY